MDMVECCVGPTISVCVFAITEWARPASDAKNSLPSGVETGSCTASYFISDIRHVSGWKRKVSIREFPNVQPKFGLNFAMLFFNG